MNITISGRKIEITQSLRQHAEDKIKKTLKYSDKIIDVHVIMYMERYLHTVEMTFNLDKKTIFAKEVSGDMYSSVNLAIDKIIKQLCKYHDRLKEHKIKIKPQEDQNI